MIYNNQESYESFYTQVYSEEDGIYEDTKPDVSLLLQPMSALILTGESFFG